jgi:hypothetical protein
MELDMIVTKSPVGKLQAPAGDGCGGSGQYDFSIAVIAHAASPLGHEGERGFAFHSAGRSAASGSRAEPWSSQEGNCVLVSPTRLDLRMGYHIDFPTLPGNARRLVVGFELLRFFLSAFVRLSCSERRFLFGKKRHTGWAWKVVGG